MSVFGRKKYPGEPFEMTATTFNTLIDVARHARDLQMPAQIRRQISRPQTILVRNDSGSDRNRFDVLLVDGPLFGPSENSDFFQNNVVVKAIKPSNVDRNYRRKTCVILAEPARAGALAKAYISGICPARVYVNDEDHLMADIVNYEPSYLQSVPHGGAARIIWKEEGTGLKWALVLLGRSELDLFVLPFLGTISNYVPPDWPSGWYAYRISPNGTTYFANYVGRAVFLHGASSGVTYTAATWHFHAFSDEAVCLLCPAPERWIFLDWRTGEELDPQPDYIVLNLPPTYHATGVVTEIDAAYDYCRADILLPDGTYHNAIVRWTSMRRVSGPPDYVHVPNISVGDTIRCVPDGEGSWMMSWF